MWHGKLRVAPQVTQAGLVAVGSVGLNFRLGCQRWPILGWGLVGEAPGET